MFRCLFKIYRTWEFEQHILETAYNAIKHMFHTQHIFLDFNYRFNQQPLLYQLVNTQKTISQRSRRTQKLKETFWTRLFAKLKIGNNFTAIYCFVSQLAICSLLRLLSKTKFCVNYESTYWMKLYICQIRNYWMWKSQAHVFDSFSCCVVIPNAFLLETCNYDWHPSWFRNCMKDSRWSFDRHFVKSGVLVLDVKGNPMVSETI